MEAQINIGFQELLKIIKKLPRKKQDELLAEIEREKKSKDKKTELRKLLLNGPIATEKQIEDIQNNRKKINEWRI